MAERRRRGSNPADDRREEELSEYLCDSPGCPNVAMHVLGYVKEIGLRAAVCDEHAPKT